jgi:hypothetical protein
MGLLFQHFAGKTEATYNKWKGEWLIWVGEDLAGYCDHGCEPLGSFIKVENLLTR